MVRTGSATPIRNYSTRDLWNLEIKDDSGVNYRADLIHMEEVRPEGIGPDTQRDPRDKSVVDSAAYFPRERGLTAVQSLRMQMGVSDQRVRPWLKSVRRIETRVDSAAGERKFSA